MLTIPPVVPHLPIPILELICDGLAAELTRLGRILGNLRSEAGTSLLSEIIEASAPAWCDHLAFHKLSEFPEKAAPINRSDEPLFALKYEPTLYEKSSKVVQCLREAACAARIRKAMDYIFASAVEHNSLGLCAAQYRKQLSDGTWSLVVEQGKKKSSLLIDGAYWTTPIEALMRVKPLKVAEFTLPGRSSDKRPIMPHPDVLLPGSISFLPLTLEQCEAAKAKRGMLTFVPGDFVGLEELRQKRYAVKERPSDADRACYEPGWVAENRALLTRHTDQSLLPKMGAPSPSPHDIMTPIVAVCRELRVLAGGKWAASRKEQEPVKFKSARSVEWRRTHSAMGKLMNLCASVTEKMRDDEEYDVWATVEPMSYKQALSYLRACSRWLIEKKIAGKQARTLKAILSKSRAFAH